MEPRNVRKAIQEEEIMGNNLESTVNKIGYEIANIVDKNLIEKLLGVLSSDGVYAMWVYGNDKLKLNAINFWSKILTEQEFINAFSNDKINLDEINKFLENKSKEIEQTSNKEKNKKFLEWQKELSKKFFHNLSEDINDLIFFRELLEKALIYARYHAKAMWSENE